MTTTPTHQPNHLHFFNHHTGRPRFHFDEASDAAAAATAAAAAAAAAAASSAKPWHDGVDAETIGHAQLKGWKIDDPKEAFGAAAKAARELEKHFGVPADRIIKVPAADAKPEDIRAYHERLGAPKEAKDYDLTAVKDPAIADPLRATLHERGVPKDAAAAVAATVAKALESMAATTTVLDAGKLAEQKVKLEQNWGGKDSSTYQLNHLNAMEGARRSGISPEAVKALESVIGYDAVMEHFRKIGKNTSQDTFVERGGPTVGEVTTIEGAIARKAELMADKAWGERLMKGGVAEKREISRLDQMISGVTL
jgi:hypothetical protein